MASIDTPLSQFAAAEPLEKGSSLWHDAWLRLRKNHLALFGAGVMLALVLVCIGGWLFGQPYYDQNIYLANATPGSIGIRVTPDDSPYDFATFEMLDDEGVFTDAPESQALRAALLGGKTIRIGDNQYSRNYHLLGTDKLGRDLFARLCWGGLISLGVGLAATAVALIIGVTYGAIAGFFGGKLDAFMMRVVDIMYSLPFTIFVILLMVLFGRHLILLFAAIGAVEWLTMARIVRSQVMAIKRMEFIEAARSLGFGRRRIIFRHILPNILGPVIVYITLTIPSVMLLEAFLSYLGLGVQPPISSLGVLIKEGSEVMEEYSWQLMYPAAIFSLMIFSLNFLGDGLRDALDVKASKD
ncbi:oligopeptide transport system permease protein [Ereboglobus sp. PH5-10]|uniref:ABC transporter permease n=1 Tax=Ereboglobus sp. PH5-10 TaxID=2940629 RepID=UPI002405ABBE|nr:ABC transporter permease [Ereboglobus sp. PH5-10]MDF9825958.1 oligopeptide transport system permease protein [Ereboglobus sp. PH5-10]